MRRHGCGGHPEIRDYGGVPLVFNIEHATNMNQNFRTTLWTGCHMQLTLMSIPVGEEIGAEIHDDVDQFIRIQNGRAKVYMGSCQNALCKEFCVSGEDAIIIPAGTWHNVVNVGNCPLKLYSLYAPPKHPVGTVHPTKADADREGH